MNKTAEGQSTALALGLLENGSSSPLSLDAEGRLITSRVTPETALLFTMSIDPLTTFDYQTDIDFAEHRGFYVSFSGTFNGVVPFGIAALDDPFPGDVRTISQSFDLEAGFPAVFHPEAVAAYTVFERLYNFWLPGPVRLGFSFSTGAAPTVLKLKIVALP